MILRALLVTLALAGCLPRTQPTTSPPLNEPVPEDRTIHRIEVERAYTLEDPRDLDFKARIAAEAALVCDSSRHVIQSIRPYGPERIGPDFLYRMNAVEITCG